MSRQALLVHILRSYSASPLSQCIGIRNHSLVQKAFIDLNCFSGEQSGPCVSCSCVYYLEFSVVTVRLIKD